MSSSEDCGDSPSAILLPELAALVLQRLPRPTLRDLCSASRHFGQLPTAAIASCCKLRLALPARDGLYAHLHSDTARQRLSFVTSVEVTGASGDALLGSSLPRLMAGLASLVPHLTTLYLRNMDMAPLIVAAASLDTLCPHLSDLRLQGAGVDDPLGATSLPDLWVALASVPTLRRLTLLALPHTAQQRLAWGAKLSLAGIGAVTQLSSLSVECDAAQQVRFTFPLANLGRLDSLTQLMLGDCSFGIASALSSLTQLQHLGLTTNCEPDNDDFTGSFIATAMRWALLPFTASRTLTSLHFTSMRFHHMQHLTPVWDVMIPALALLVRLDVDATLTCAELAAMPTLNTVRCVDIIMPHDSTSTSLPHIAVIDCSSFIGPFDPYPDEKTQSLAQTFPNRAALSWDNRAAQPTAHSARLLPHTLEGRMPRLRRLGLKSLHTCFHSSCAPALADLVVGRASPSSWQQGHEHAARAHGSPAAALILQLQALGQHLQRVALADPQTDDAGLAALATAWPTVREVAVCCTVGVTDAGLARLVGLTRLRRVSLLCCPAVTLAGIRTLLTCRSLTSVEVCQCQQVGAAEVARVHNEASSDGRCYGLPPHVNVVHLGDLKVPAG